MLSKYLNVGIAAVVIAIIGTLTYQANSLDKKNRELTARLAQSTLQSQMQANIINQYSQDREYMDTLLTERANRSAKQERALNAQIKKLKEDISGFTCTVPSTVIEQLRQSY